MLSGRLGPAIRSLERLLQGGAIAGMSEVQLLERFVSRRDGAAFEALVARHGAMVLGVCRQCLHNPHDVEDAFQATFLVLVRKASTLRDRELLGNWLYGVAYRVATRTRCDAARRRAREAPGVGDVAEDDDPNGRDGCPWLHEEVQRLPEKYRAPIVLCYLEGLTHEQAAEQLGWPVGSVKGRLSRARELLRSRLLRRGLAPSAGLLLVLLSRDASAAVPSALLECTIEAANHLAAGNALAAGAISARAVALTKGVSCAMLLGKLKVVAVTLGVAALLTMGAGVIANQTPGGAIAPGAGNAKPPTASADGPTRKTTVAPAPPVAADGPRVPDASVAPAPPVASGAVQTTRRNVASGPDTRGASGGGGFGADGPPGAGALDHENRIAIARMSAVIESLDKSPLSQAVLRKLQQPLTMSFANETPLDDLLKYIKSATSENKDNGIPIYVDPVGLAKAEKTMTSPVVLDLEGIPLKTSLRLALKQLGLAYCVKDGVLMISSVEGIVQELEEAQGGLTASESPATPAKNPFRRPAP